MRRLLGAAALFSPAAFARATPGDDIFRDPTAAQTIGRAYLATNPDLNLRVLLRDAGLSEDVRGQGPRTRVCARSAEDFAKGDTVLVNGWVLSRAEASACGLAARSALIFEPLVRHSV